MSEIISHKNPKSIIAESVKILRTNLQFSNVDGNLKTVMVTSSVPGEGKSFTSSNLAVAFAQLGMKVLVVDCDMRRGTQHKQFTVSNTNGLSDLLIDSTAELVKYVKPTSIENLFVVTAGTVPPNPSELLSSKSFETVLSLKALVTLTLITPSIFIVPLITLSFTVTSFGTDSPVREEVLIELEPSIITPSRGIFSPGLTIIISLIFTSFGFTVNSFPSRMTLAYSGFISIRFVIDFRLLPTAIL